MNTTFTKITLDKNKILDQLTSLPKIAKADKWEFDYDSQLDELVFGLKKMPKNSFLYNINDEINLFVTPDSKVKGMFIEYFSGNYIEHNKSFSPVLDILSEESQEKKTDEEEILVEALENKLTLEAVRALFKKGDQLVTGV